MGHFSCNSRYPRGSLFWFNPQNICILLITITLINIANIMFPFGFPVFPTFGTPQAGCTLAQPSKTPEICAPSEFKPHNPPILWKEAESRSISMGLMWACFRVWYPNGLVFFTILVSVWVQIFGLVDTPLPTSRGRPPPPCVWTILCS